MGWIQDILQEVPLSAVLKERVELAEQKYEHAVSEADFYKKKAEDLERKMQALEIELTEHRANAAAMGDSELSEETQAVLVYLFQNEKNDTDQGALAHTLGMELGVAKYHLDLLDTSGFAKCTGGNYLSGEVYWNLTQEGRKYVVERGLHTAQ